MTLADHVSPLAVTAAEIAWPLVLVLCVALMVFPFVFLILAKRGDPGPGDAGPEHGTG